MDVRIFQRLPSCAEYNMFRQHCEWPTYNEDIASRGLKNSLFCVVVETLSGDPVGMGRIVGDGFIYLHIQDVLVIPDYQRMGIGKKIMHELMEWINNAGGKNTNIGLFCSKGREDFYRKFGFVERPNQRFGAGMIRITE